MQASEDPGVVNNTGESSQPQVIRNRGQDEFTDDIEACQETLISTPPGDPKRAEALKRLCTCHCKRYYASSTLEDLEAAILTYQEAVKEILGCQDCHAGRQNTLSILLQDRYTMRGSVEDLNDSIRSSQEAIRLTSKNEERARMLGNMGNTFRTKYGRTGARADLEEAIKTCRQALATIPTEHPDRPGMLTNLGNCLRDIFLATGAIENLEESIEIGRESVKATAADHPDLASRLNNLGISLGDQYKSEGSDDDLGEAILNCQRSIDLTPRTHWDWPSRQNNLGVWLRERYCRFGRLEDLENAIASSKAAVNRIPLGHSGRPMLLNNMSNILGEKYDQDGSTESLELSIDYSKQTAETTPLNDPNRPMWLSNYSSRLFDRYKRFGRLEDLNNSVDIGQKALEALRPEHPYRPGLLCNLGIHLGERYNREGQLGDLQKAIESCQEALSLTSPNHPNRRQILGNLSMWLHSRYVVKGNIEDLAESISASRGAIERTEKGHPMRTTWVDGLANMLCSRYKRTAALVDLEEAISCSREVIAAAADTPQKLENLRHFSRLLGERFRRVDTFNDLQEAIEICRKVVEATPSDHAGRRKSFTTLSNMLHERFKITKSLKDLEESIDYGQKSFTATGPNEPAQSGLCSNMGILLHSKYHQTGVLKDLADAIEYGQKAANTISEDHAHRSETLSMLGSCLHCMYHQTRSPEDFDNAITSLRAASSQENGTPLARVRAHQSLGSLFVEEARWAEASAVFESAINVLPEVSPRTLSRADQQYVLNELSGLSSAAAATALKADRPASDALALLESGRCVISGLAMNARTDVSDLRVKDPILCEKYEQCRDGISQHGFRQRHGTNYEDSTQDALPDKALAELQNLEAQIRQISGFERFQLPPKPEELMALAKRGPIVSFNISKIRCDAILVTSSRIWAKELPHLAHDTVHEKARSISNAGQTSRRKMKVRVKKKKVRSWRRQLRDDLWWLWSSTVLPVLEELLPEPSQRVWWVTGGSMGLLPLHAAGSHSKGSSDNTMSRVVSSYVSTFKALRYARERGRNESTDGRLLLVDMAETPGYDDLNTSHEVEVIKEEFGDLVDLYHQPTKSDVLRGLEGCSFVHFACHGTSNTEDPSEGGVLLVEEGKAALLKISDLDRLNLNQAEIAYLSACSTAELPAEKLVDEAIHLSNSFQVIGFRHVIGTMWDANDYAAGEVARMFYRLLKKSRVQSTGELDVARALHEAIMDFKGRPGHKKNLALWAPFIHIGV